MHDEFHDMFGLSGASTSGRHRCVHFLTYMLRAYMRCSGLVAGGVALHQPLHWVAKPFLLQLSVAELAELAELAAAAALSVAACARWRLRSQS